MILTDANILMYAAGADHPHKQPSVSFLRRVATGEIDATVDSETLQEMLHRYRAISRWPDGRRVYDLARRIFPDVIPLTAEIIDQVRLLMDVYTHLTARDATHAAVVFKHQLDGICSFDRDFDSIPELRRVEPD